ncbi:MAG TPA: type I polyketide synthase, partial [Anaerolineales bacterium]|nr:type I polyketide synthase [Anaerolineales bacterium]
MSQTSSNKNYRELLQQALLSLEQMQARLHAAENASHEPLAIIGTGFRFPGGANDSASFWNLLYNGVDAITEVPPDRWNADQFYDPDPEAVGKMYTRWGGFLDQVDQFDPQFFGISPREALSMDPQQRLLLETTWEALENAGQASSKLAGSRTGVFVGIVGSDYANLKMISGGINEMDAYFGTGVSRSIAAGRIAYTFGLHGPAVAVDTACSSSLVAVHQACQSLRARECDMAVAGGVNMILEPSASISTSRSRMMSFDGHCKTFDATADGYVRSEGCAMIALKRLSDAVANGDNILAVIRGTAVNQDGRSNGLTAPNGKAQEAVIRAALEDAKLKPADISYVETHGTGTSLGDPIEVRALGAVFSEGHSKDDPLTIGSVKTNVGHLEAAAGIVGLVKVVLALQNKTIPPHINLDEPNPYIPWDEIPVTVPTKPTPWTSPNGKPRIAGLSSFGFSGTNSHIVIAEASPQAVQEAKTERASQLFTLSAKTEPALRQLAEKYETHFRQNPSLSLADVTYSLNTGRSHFNYRLALTATSLSQAQEKLSAWQRDDASSGVHSGAMAEEGKPEVVFLFTGQGSQYAGMARQLYKSQPTFRKVLDQCAELLQPHLEKSLLSVIYPESSDDENLIHQTAYTQPALFAIEYSLAKLWQSWGVEPSVVMGHSIGEYVAACIAGVFSLEDGLKLVAARGRLMQSLPAGGIMAAVFADEKRVQAAIAPHTKEVSIAALNGPDAVVISGAESSVGLVMEALQKDGIKSQKLNVSHAFHSPLMDSILEEFEQVAKSIHYHSPNIGVISNVSGRLIVDDSISNPRYWREHVRQAVRFEDGIKTLRAENYHLFLEIGPHPTLLGMARRCEPGSPKDIWLPSLRTGRGDWEQMLASLAQLYVNGQDVDWDAFERDDKGQRRRLELPTYSFQREHYWLDFETTADSTFETKTDHPLLGSRLSTALPVFQKKLNASNPAYLADHRIHDIAILPAAAYVEIALAAAKHALRDGVHILEDISIHEALPLFEDKDRVAQIVLTPDA